MTQHIRLGKVLGAKAFKKRERPVCCGYNPRSLPRLIDYSDLLV